MGNSVATVNSDATKCTLEDVEVCYKGVHEIYTVNEHGEAEMTKEVYGDESYFAYYYCENCESYFDADYRTQDDAWREVKEHFNED